jgi:CHASE2 domain-containing sensor protein
MRLDLSRNPGANIISIVNIDDKSLKQIGPWPWPRYVLAEMIPILKSNGAKFVVFDLLFSEKEQHQGLREIRASESYPGRGPSPNDAWLADSLSELEKKLDSDSLLTRALKESNNVYLPVLGTYGKYDSVLALPADSFLKENSLKTKLPLQNLVPVNQLVTPFPELSESPMGSDN